MKRAREKTVSGQPTKRSRASSPKEIGLATQPSGSNHREQASSYLEEVQSTLKHEKYIEFTGIMKEYKLKKINKAQMISQVKEVLRGHPSLLSRFSVLLPQDYTIALEDNFPEISSTEYEKALYYVYKIKMQYKNDEGVYEDFLDILHQYRTGNKSITEAHEAVASLFYDHQYLVTQFTFFLPHATGLKTSAQRWSSKTVASGVSFSNEEPSASTHFKNIEGCPENHLSKEIQLRKGPCTKTAMRTERQKKNAKEQKKKHDKYMNRPTSELDRIYVTPSYFILPEKNPEDTTLKDKPRGTRLADVSCKGKKGLADEVLNKSCASVAYGVERGNLDQNQNEKIEDDRYEMDILLETTAMTIKRIQDLLAKLEDASEEEKSHIDLHAYLRGNLAKVLESFGC